MATPSRRAYRAASDPVKKAEGVILAELKRDKPDDELILSLLREYPTVNVNCVKVLNSSLEHHQQHDARFLLERGGTVPDAETVGLACFNTSEILRLVLEKGGNPNSSFRACSVIHACKDMPAFLEVLLEFGGDINTPDRWNHDRETILFSVQRRRHESCQQCKYLCQLGATVRNYPKVTCPYVKSQASRLVVLTLKSPRHVARLGIKSWIGRLDDALFRRLYRFIV